MMTKMRAAKPILALATLVLCALINPGTVKANCFDEFVTNNPDAMYFDCCDPFGEEGYKTVPSTITELTKLTQIFISDCYLTGTFPWNGWDKMIALESLETTGSTNDGMYIAESLDLSTLPSLNTLHLRNVPTSGSFPEWILKMTNLKQLILAHSDLTGTLPETLKRLPNLTAMGFPSNKLSGPISEWFKSRSEDFFGLDLAGNKGISGTLPRSFTGFDKMRVLYLDNTQINGTLPSEMSSLTELLRLTMTGTNITGSVPASFGELVKMQRFNFSDNPQLTGSLPAEMSSLTDLRYLGINNTRLHEPLPDFPSTGLDIDGQLTNLAPGADCSTPGNETLCSRGDDQCDDGICLGRTDPLTAAPTGAPTDVPTFVAEKTNDDQTFVFVGIGAGCLVVGFVAAVVFMGRCKSGGGNNGGTGATSSSYNNGAEDASANGEVTSGNPVFDERGVVRSI